MVRRLSVLISVAILVAAADATAQTGEGATGNPGTAAPESSGSASFYTYLVPDDTNYVQPTLRLDRDRLHIEGRFNYEDVDTASAWVGRMFSVGTRVRARTPGRRRRA